MVALTEAEHRLILAEAVKASAPSDFWTRADFSPARHEAAAD
jgi:hypothetical protein